LPLSCSACLLLPNLQLMLLLLHCLQLLFLLPLLRSL
jgi:hypothetical protein